VRRRLTNAPAMPGNEPVVVVYLIAVVWKQTEAFREALEHLALPPLVYFVISHAEKTSRTISSSRHCGWATVGAWYSISKYRPSTKLDHSLYLDRSLAEVIDVVRGIHGNHCIEVRRHIRHRLSAGPDELHIIVVERPPSAQVEVNQGGRGRVARSPRIEAPV